MGFLDAMLGAVKGGAGRDYSDLKPGDFPAETAQYALKNEVKAVSKVRIVSLTSHWGRKSPFVSVSRRMVTRSRLSEVMSLVHSS